MFQPLFNERIVEAIENELAYTASDASVKNGQMAGCWTIRNESNELLLQNHLYHKEWENNTIVGAEAITLLELIEVIERKGRGISHGKIIIGVDNRKVYQRIVEEIAKPNVYAKDSGAEIAQIKRLLEKIKFEIQIELVKGHKKPEGNYQQKPLQHLILECDQEATKQRERISEKNQIHNIKFEGFCALKLRGNVCSKSIYEAI